MKTLFLVRIFETIQAINMSNTNSLSFHEVGLFVDFLYTRQREGFDIYLWALLQRPSALFLDEMGHIVR